MQGNFLTLVRTAEWGAENAKTHWETRMQIAKVWSAFGPKAAKMMPRRTQRGQGMMEYVIIVALIAVAGIGIYSAWGRTIRNQSAGMAEEIAGKKANIANAQDAANAAAGRANDPQKEGMGGYNYANDQKK